MHKGTDHQLTDTYHIYCTKTHTDKHIYTNIKGTAIILIIKNVAKYLNYIVNLS